MPTSFARYPALMILLHWTMLVLIAAVYAAIELREFFPKGSAIRDGFKALHFMLGLSVLALIMVRLVVRWRGPLPPIAASPAMQRLAARLVHLALYAFMIGMPLAGWMILSASGAPIPFFLFELPPLVPPNEALAGWAKEIHETVGMLGYWLIGLHAAAALAHHYLWKDDVLRRMAPWRHAGS